MNNEERVEAIGELIKRFKPRFDVEQVSGLTVNELSVLLTIYGLSKKNSSLTMSDVGEVIGLCRPAMSQVAAKLESKGMIKRETDKSDRRKVLVSVTKKAADILQRAENIRKETFFKVVTEMGERDADEFIRLANKFISITEDKDA